ncbi:MAG: hypothetical protein U0231_14865 [Nitrospiraceae bacterium]
MFRSDPGAAVPWVFPALLLIVGVLIGVLVASDLGWLPTGHAVLGVAGNGADG